MTILAEGTQGHLTGAALERFGLAGESPQVWALGVKEVWKVAKPLDRVIHTMGWPLRPGRKYREFGGSFIYPMGDDMVTIGMVVGLDYRDAELSVHDLLQELKTHPRVRKILEGGERVQWGAKTIPEGGFVALPKKLHAPGLLLCGDGRRLRQRAGAEGHPLRDRVGAARRRGRVAHARARRVVAVGARDVRRGAARVVHLERPARGAEHAPGVRARLLRRRRAGERDDRVEGKFPPGDLETERDAEQSLIVTDRATSYPAPDGKLTFDKLSSVFASGNRTRDDQPNHIRVQTKVPRELAELWAHMCPAQVYEVGDAGGRRHEPSR